MKDKKMNCLEIDHKMEFMKKKIKNQCSNLTNLKAIQTSCNMRLVQADVNAPEAKKVLLMA